MGEVSKEDLAKLIFRWRYDILAFAREAVKFEPTPQQEAILLDVMENGSKVTVRSGHGTGKTAVEAIIVLWALVCFKEVTIGCTAPTAAQLDIILFPEISKWRDRMHPWLKDQIIWTKKKVFIQGAENLRYAVSKTSSKEKPEALQGLHAENMFIIVDESFGVEQKVFEVAEGTLSTPNARVFMAGNPTRLSGYAYDTFKGRGSDQWKKHVLSSVDSPIVSEEYVNSMKEKYGEGSDIYKVRVLGEFPDASAAQIIPSILVETAFGKHLDARMYEHQPSVLGVDIARFGDDRSVIFHRKGLMCEKLWESYSSDLMTVADLVSMHWNITKAEYCFIDVGGLGAGVVDRLRQMGRDPVEINFGGKSIEDRFLNKRSEMWWKMREWLERGGAIPPDESLRDDLVVPTYMFTPQGKISLERKEDIKKRGMPSPDLGDALSLTFAADVGGGVTSRYEPSSIGKCKTEYELF